MATTDRRLFTPPRRSAGCGDGIHIVQFWAVCPQRSSLRGDAANSVHGYDEDSPVVTTGRADERTGGGPVKQAAQKPGSTSLTPVVPPQLTGSNAGSPGPVQYLGPRPVHPDRVVPAQPDLQKGTHPEPALTPGLSACPAPGILAHQDHLPETQPVHRATRSRQGGKPPVPG
jgi:hypothetical protein